MRITLLLTELFNAAIGRCRALIFVFLLFTVGCYWERPTRTAMEGGIVPTFVLSGTGNLSSFSVYSVSPSDRRLGRIVDSLSDDAFFSEPPVWRIEIERDQSPGRPVGQIGRLTYGIVPPNYKQTIPPVGSPPAIVPSNEYFFDIFTVNAPTLTGGFKVVHGDATQIQLDLPCLQSHGGKQITVPCAHNP